MGRSGAILEPSGRLISRGRIEQLNGRLGDKKQRRIGENFSGFVRAPSTPSRRTSITPAGILGHLGAYHLEVPIQGPSEIPENLFQNQSYG